MKTDRPFDQETTGSNFCGSEIDPYDSKVRQPRQPMSEKNVSDLISSTRRDGDAAVVVIRGEIDLHNSPDLRNHMLQYLDGSIKHLILNLTQVPYMDSSAIAVFVEALQKLRKIGGKVYLTNLQPRVKGLLEIAKLDSIFVVCADEQAAMTATR